MRSLGDWPGACDEPVSTSSSRRRWKRRRRLSYLSADPHRYLGRAVARSNTRALYQRQKRIAASNAVADRYDVANSDGDDGCEPHDVAKGESLRVSERIAVGEAQRICVTIAERAAVCDREPDAEADAATDAKTIAATDHAVYRRDTGPGRSETHAEAGGG